MHKEADQFSGRWAIITLHPALLSKTEQIARARAWGIKEELIEGDDKSALIFEDARKVKRTTNWPASLPRRAAFIENMRFLEPENGQVFFATPLCVGFGPAHARQTIEAMWSVGLSVYVHSLGALYKEGDDLTDFLELVKVQANAWHQQASRDRKPKTKRKPKS